MKETFISTSGKRLQYLHFNSDSNTKLPIIIYIHGAGSRGNDADGLMKNPALCKIIEHASKDAIIVAPQCHCDTWFELYESLLEFIECMINKSNVDKSRVYITGTSMGAYTTWQLCMSRPDWFSAAVPVCGGGMYWNAGMLKNISIWAFHGALDDCVYSEESLKMVKAVNQKGGNAKITIFPHDEHDSWTNAYSTEEMWIWLFEQKRS